MILAQLPTGLNLVLMIGFVVCFGLVALFVVLGFGRATSSRPELEAFKQSIEEITRSELEADHKEKNVIDPKTWDGYWYKLVEATGRVPSSPEKPAQFILLTLVILAAFGFLVFPRGVIGLIALPVGALLISRAILLSEAKKRKNTLHKQLPNLIAGLEANITTGQTPQSAMIAIADDIPSPLGDELKIMKSELELNVPLVAALDHLAERVPSRDVQFLISAIKIAAESGEDLAPQLKIIREIVSNRTRLQQKLASAVASVTPTIWISAIVIPAMFIFQYVSNEANRSFWFTLTGIICLIITSALYAGGMWISKKLVKGVEKA